MTSEKKKIVAVIGSSGGGTATLGHTETPALLETIHKELQAVDLLLGHALMVSLHHGKGLDTADPYEDLATLYQVSPAAEDGPTAFAGPRYFVRDSDTFSCHEFMTGTLNEVNGMCRRLQGQLANKEMENIDALICISCSVDVFEETLQAAAARQIPVTGSGGTSLSLAAHLFHLHLVGNAGGSVATTSYTRAVSYTHALADYWELPYQPWKHQKSRHAPSYRSLLNATLPAFWGVCLTKFVLDKLIHQLAKIDIQTNSFWSAVLENTYLVDLSNGLRLENLPLASLSIGLRFWALPMACAVIVATSSSKSEQQQSRPTSSLIMASVIASTACRSIVSGLLAGRLVSLWTALMLYWCIFNNVPATMTNLLTAGGVGGATALALIPFQPVFRWASEALRHAILWTVTLPNVSNNAIWRLVTAFAWGCWSCYGSKVGWYHAVHLPLILLEMEEGDASFLGAVDQLTLVLVCAGICAGNIFVHKFLRQQADNVIVSNADAALCRRGLWTNLVCGDFIEVCYPYMDRHPIINVGGYLASGFSCACLVASLSSGDAESSEELQQQVPRSLAYLPMPVSILIAGDQWYRMALASAIAVGVSFLATLLNFFWVLWFQKDKVR